MPASIDTQTDGYTPKKKKPTPAASPAPSWVPKYPVQGEANAGARAGVAPAYAPATIDNPQALLEAQGRAAFDNVQQSRQKAMADAGVRNFLNNVYSTTQGYKDSITAAQAKASVGAAHAANVDKPYKAKGVLGFALRTTGAAVRGAAKGLSVAAETPGIKQALGGLGAAQEQIAQSYYAGALRRAQGGSELSQIRATVSGLPGLGALSPGGSAERKAVEAVNSRSERERLRATGQLASFGENVMSGQATNRGALPKTNGQPKTGSYPVDQATGALGGSYQGSGIGSAIVDAAFQIGTDPLTFLLPDIGKTFGHVGEVAAARGARAANIVEAETLGEKIAARLGANTAEEASRIQAEVFARRMYLETSTGSALHQAVVDATLEAGGDVERLAKVLRLDSESLARELVDAANSGGAGAVADKAAALFVSGEWNPRVNLRRQLAGKISEKLVTTGGHSVPGFLGRSPVKSPSIVRDTLESLARGGQAKSFGRFNDVHEAATVIAERVGWASPDLTAFDAHTNAFGATWETHLSPERRMNWLWDYYRTPAGTGQWKASTEYNSDFSHLIDTVRKDFASMPDDQRLSTLRGLELIAASLDGRLGEKAKAVAEAGLAMSAPSQSSSIQSLVRQAVENADRTHPRATVERPAPASSWPPQGQLQLFGDKPLTGQPPKAGPYVVFPRDSTSYIQAPLKSQQLLTFGEEIARPNEKFKQLGLSLTKPVQEQLDLGAPSLSEIIAQHDAAWQAHMDEVNTRLDAGLKETLDKLTAPTANKAAAEEAASVARARVYGVADVEKLPEGALRDRFVAEYAAAKSTKRVALLNRYLGTLIEDPHAMLEAMTIAGTEDVVMAGRAAARAAMLNGDVGFFRRIPGRFANVLLALVESSPPEGLKWNTASAEVGRNERRAGVNRLAEWFGYDRFTRAQITEAFDKAQTEDDVIALVRGLYHDYAIENGVNPKVVLGAYDAKVRGISSGLGFTVDAEGNIVNEIQTVAQRLGEIPLLDPDTVRQLVREARVAADIATPGERLRAGLGKLNVSIPGLRNREGELMKLTEVGDKLHRLWKFTVVTNLPTVFVGAYGGYQYGEASGENPIKYALLGAGIGLLGPARYLQRLVGIEERGIRYTLSRGFNREWIPVLSKHMAEDLGPGAIKFGDYWAVRQVPSAGIDSWVSHSFWTTLGKDYVSLAPKDARYIDGWWRLINWQIHPESDLMARATLEWAAGLRSEDELTSAMKDFLKSPDGARWLSRMRGGINGPTNEFEALERYKDFVSKFVPSELAQARLGVADAGEGEVSRELLKTMLKGGKAPDYIPAQRSWVIPSMRDLGETYRSFTSKFIFAGPSGNLNREPMARWAYKDEYARLVAHGVEKERAAELASQYAIKKTNEVMFRISDESRFAKKVDFIFPFQQPREELLRVYMKLVTDNIGRTLIVGENAAKAWNAGKEAGIFRKDANGNYYMHVPGSGRISRLLTGHTFDFDMSLNSLLFVGQGAFGASVLPAPGGPAWSVVSRAFINAHPDAYGNLNPTVRELLFPYGATGNLTRAEPNRLWYSFMFRPAPWQFASQQEQENEINSFAADMARQLYYENMKAHPSADPQSWIPSQEEVQKQAQAAFRAWALMGSILPGSSRPVFASKNELDGLLNVYKGDIAALLADHPELSPMLTGKTKYVGPDDYQAWKAQADSDLSAFGINVTQHYTVYKTPAEMLRDMRSRLAEQAAYDERANYFEIPDSRERAQALEQWDQQHPELAARTTNAYNRDKELAKILATTPQALMQDVIDSWRKRYNVSYNQYLKLKDSVPKEFKVNPWREARPTQVILDYVNAQKKYGVPPDVAVRSLAPAEQLKYWFDREAKIAYDTGNQSPNDVVEESNFIKSQISALYAQNQNLSSGADDLHGGALIPKGVLVQLKQIQDAAKTFDTQRTAKVRLEIANLDTAIDDAYKAKQYATAKKLTDRRTSLYGMISVWQQEMYHAIPDLARYLSDVQVMAGIFDPDLSPTSAEHRKAAARMQQINDQHSLNFLPTSDEAWYNNAGEVARQAYIDDLYMRLSLGERVTLDTAPAKGTWKPTTALRWSRLTPFQQELLERNMPTAIAGWKQAEWIINNTPSKSKPDYGPSADLQWVVDVIKEYDKRGAGAPPDAYKTFLSISTTEQKSAFLEKHPEVKKWLQDGPLNAMPPSLRFAVNQLIIEHGAFSIVDAKGNYWDGPWMTKLQLNGNAKSGSGRRRRSSTPRSVDLAWAYLQLRTWSKRAKGEKAPHTYDVWVQMPTGVDKANYLKAHPEIQTWLQNGPMANMPEAQRSIVRDIMLKYGKWTTKQDPLAVVINGFYSTPQYAKQQYLEQHPELQAYWNATRSPLEQEQYALSDQYFSIQDPFARKMFLGSHPELQQFFLDRRNRRYEDFLNRVAVYMGSNPKLFDIYAKRQDDMLSDLLRKFGESPFLKEQITPERAQGHATTHRNTGA